MADNVENKVEETAAPEVPKAEAAKKSVDVNELAAKGKAGLEQGMGFITKLYADKGLMLAMFAPIVVLLFQVVLGKGALGVLLSILVAGANALGVKSIMPAKDKADKE